MIRYIQTKRAALLKGAALLVCLNPLKTLDLPN